MTGYGFSSTFNTDLAGRSAKVVEVLESRLNETMDKNLVILERLAGAEVLLWDMEPKAV